MRAGPRRPAAPDRPDPGLAWYAAALAVYIGAGFFLKSVLLNWVVGPLFPLVALYLVPRLVRKVTKPEPVE